MRWPTLCDLPVGLLVLAFTFAPAQAAVTPRQVPSAASFYVPTLPDLHQDDVHPLKIFAGHLESDPNPSASPTDVAPHLYFVLVKARKTADKERILFWFNGGPGCSSFDGLMLETGPFRPDGNGGLKTIDGGWEEYTNMVFVDQPAGTGYSYTSTNKYVHELGEAAEQVVEFMRNFYRVFPEYMNTETYLGGESYAGQYIPYIADAILTSNLPTNLAGAAIGNGWIDGRSQYPAYLEYATRHGILEENSESWKEAKQFTDECMEQFEKITGPEPVNMNVCEELLRQVSAIRRKSVDGIDMCMNMYDIRLDDTWPACGMNWPVEVKDTAKYLGRSDVKRAFHATAKSEAWTECSGRVGSELTNAHTASAITILPSVVERIPVMLFAGDQDFICNYVGIQNLIQKMTWNGMTGLGTFETKTWVVDGVPAGTWVESRNLTYVKIFNSSHMVPYDLPHVSHDMILRFMGMNFSAITDGSVKIPSKVGDEEKPSIIEGSKDGADDTLPVPPSKTPEQDKAMWEAYYNAGSAALVLLLIGIIIGLFFFCRNRRRRKSTVQLGTVEENIPLSQSVRDEDDIDGHRQRKGKNRADVETVFEVGSDEEEGYKDDSTAH